MDGCEHQPWLHGAIGQNEPKRGKIHTNLYLCWTENIVRSGPALGAFAPLQYQNYFNNISWALTSSHWDSLAALGRNMMVLVWQAFQISPTDISSRSCLEGKATHQAKLCLSLWYLLEQVWCSLRTGFDATSMPFSFKLKFLESGSPQQWSAGWLSLFLSSFQWGRSGNKKRNNGLIRSREWAFHFSEEILVIKKRNNGLVRSREWHQHLCKEALVFTWQPERKQPCATREQERSAREKDKKEPGLKLLISYEQSSKENKNTGSWACAQVMPTLNLTSALDLCCERFSHCWCSPGLCYIKCSLHHLKEWLTDLIHQFVFCLKSQRVSLKILFCVCSCFRKVKGPWACFKTYFNVT